MKISVVLVTCPDLETAKTISRSLVTQKLAACANIIPGLTSIFEWE
ncbi:MAG: divalent cation tolerance protein CutA [Bdellovibrionota bacterium]